MDARLIVICLECASPNGQCNGACPCPEDGLDILSYHAGKKFCPAGKFDNLPEVGDQTKKLSAPPRVFNRVPRKQWPDWAHEISDRFAADGDAGIGDSVARELGKGGEAVKMILRAAGIACGCDARRDEWNIQYPYKVSESL